MEYKGLTLDKFQEDAIAAIESNKSVVVSAPTGSGKTLIADYIIERDLKQGMKIIYTAPIKALSNQKYKEFCRSYGEQNVGLMTGDMVKNSSASILIMTTEIYRNMAISRDPLLNTVSYVIFDEIHFINDVERGYVWEESIIFSQPHARLLCLSATIPNAEEFAAWIQAIKEHPVMVVRHDIRPIPLHINFYDTELGITTLKEIKDLINIPDYDYVRGKSRHRQPKIPPPSHLHLINDIKDKLPCMFFSFSRMGCQQKAEQLARERLFTPDAEISAFMTRKLSQAPPEINKLASTKMLRNTLAQGIGFHHAGLLPIIKEIVEELFAMGKIRVLYTTETFAVGLNMPAKSVCFESLRKYDGMNFRLLDSKEFFQIAGRAGRRGIDTEGYVYAMINRNEFEYERTKELTSRDTTPIKSQFKLSVNTVLNLIKNHEQKEIDEILCKSFHAYQRHGKDLFNKRDNKSHNMFVNYVKRLEKLGYVDHSKLTQKGDFLSHIYADELVIGEIFATEVCEKLDSYQILLVLAAICFEGKRVEWRKTYHSPALNSLRKILDGTPLAKDKRFYELHNLTALVHPCYNGANIFELLDNSSLLEGDIVRFFRQIMDRMNQIRMATGDRDLIHKIEFAKDKIVACLGDMGV